MGTAYQSSSSAFVLAGASIVIPKPVGLGVGDLMVAFVQKNVAGATGTWTLPSLWSLFEGTDPGGPGPRNPKTLVAEKIADAADVAATDFTFSHSDVSTPNMNGAILRFSGGAGIASRTVTKLPGPNSPVTTMTCPDHTTAEAPDLIIRALMFDGTGPTDTVVVTPPGGITQRAVSRRASPPAFSSDSMLFVFTDNVQVSPPGSTGAAVFGVTGLGGDERGVHYTLAIQAGAVAAKRHGTGIGAVGFLPFNPSVAVTGGQHDSGLDISSAVTLTPPEDASRLVIQALDQNVRFTLDGVTTPTAAIGFRLTVGDPPRVITIAKDTIVQVIEELATASLQFQWGA